MQNNQMYGGGIYYPLITNFHKSLQLQFACKAFYYQMYNDAEQPNVWWGSRAVHTDWHKKHQWQLKVNIKLIWI